MVDGFEEAILTKQHCTEFIIGKPVVSLDTLHHHLINISLKLYYFIEIIYKYLLILLNLLAFINNRFNVNYNVFA